jgi:hypothetical protein
VDITLNILTPSPLFYTRSLQSAPYLLHLFPSGRSLSFGHRAHSRRAAAMLSQLWRVFITLVLLHFCSPLHLHYISMPPCHRSTSIPRPHPVETVLSGCGHENGEVISVPPPPLPLSILPLPPYLSISISSGASQCIHYGPDILLLLLLCGGVNGWVYGMEGG